MDYKNLAKGLSTASGAAPVVLGDLTDMYKAYNPTFIGNPQQNFNNIRDINQVQNMSPNYMTNDMRSIGVGKMFLNSQKNALEGASAFSGLGPWGMLGGAIGGTITSLISDIGHNTIGMDKHKDAVNNFNNQLARSYDAAMLSAVDAMNEDSSRNRNISYFADGGQIQSIEDQLFNEFNNGGSHEANPNGGIPIGFGMNGNPNMVEEGEVKFKDYIFSNRISLDSKTAKQLQLPEKFVKKSYADIAKNLQREYKERQNDPISKAGVEAMLGRLQQAQETFKAARQPRTAPNTFAEGGSLDGLKDPPIVFDPNALRNSDPKLQPQYTVVDNTNTVQRQSPNVIPQKQTPITFIEPAPVAIPKQQIAPIDNVYTTQSTPASNQEVATVTAQDFLTDFMSRPIQDELYEQELAELNPQQRQLVKSIGKETVYQGRRDWSNKTFGKVSQGKDYNDVQNWWRDFSQTQKGQEITKFINNPIINTGAMLAAPGLAVGLMAADYADQYGQGVDAGEIGKDVLQDIGTMMVAGRLMGGNQLNMMPNNLGVRFKGKKFLEQMATIPPKNGAGVLEKNINPKTGMLNEFLISNPNLMKKAIVGKSVVGAATVSAGLGAAGIGYQEVIDAKQRKADTDLNFEVRYLDQLSLDLINELYSETPNDSIIETTIKKMEENKDNFQKFSKNLNPEVRKYLLQTKFIKDE